jgi:hypothetical protein
MLDGSLRRAGIHVWHTAILILALGLPARAATAGLALLPGRLEIPVTPGVQKTVSFEIESPPSDEPVRGRLLLSLTDWDLAEDGSLIFQEPASQKMSAATWITFTPAAVSIASGQKYLVRVTLDVPAGTQPGVYRAGIFVQERPPAAPPKPGEHNILFRFRYMETLYAIVGPVAARPGLVDAILEPTGQKLQVVCKMKNEGTGFARPRITWSLRSETHELVAEMKSHEATILLPKVTLNERFPLETLSAGRYELSMAVDFNDDGPVQSMVRTVEIAPPAAVPPAPASTLPKQP